MNIYNSRLFGFKNGNGSISTPLRSPKVGIFGYGDVCEIEFLGWPRTELENEVPTIADLYDAMDNGLINQVMFNQLVGMVKGEEKLSDEQLHEIITVAIYSADSIQKMDDIKKAMLLDDNVLRSLDIKDITLFTAIVDRASKNFPAHKDYKTYSKLIDAKL